MPARRRRSGILLPLFSCPSRASWGIGDIGDVAQAATWLAGAGQRVLQLLPLNEMAFGDPSPYSATSAMAIDPVFICLSAVPEFVVLGGEGSLSSRDREALDEVRHARRVEHRTVRRLKHAALQSAFEQFDAAEWRRETPRALAFRRFLAAEAWWLDDYALFRAIHAGEGHRPWTEWPDPLRHGEAEAVGRARHELARDVRFHQYLQWLAGTQWQQARAHARARGVELLGDLPFMVNGDSADVWTRQLQFLLDAAVGAPPDAFSETGQDWGMPVYQWDQVAADDFRWLRDRARRSADLYDGYRIDHLVGFYRTYARPRGSGEPFFTPAEQPAQPALGERTLGIFRESGAEIIAEDLGTVPDFVRESLVRLGVPGFRVFRWERDWHLDGQPFRDPADYPALSVAASGTHDTEPLAEWWEAAPAADRRQVNDLATIKRFRGAEALPDSYDASVRDTLLEALFASGSDLLLLPVQDVFGWRDRINDPATTSADNWTFRLPWPSDELGEVPEARERQATLRVWADRYGRL